VASYRDSYSGSTNTKRQQRVRRKDKTETRELNQLRLCTFKRKVLKVSVHLQTALATEANEPERQWLSERLNTVKLECSNWEHEWAVFGVIIDVY
jgi:hypothetical protein